MAIYYGRLDASVRIVKSQRLFLASNQAVYEVVKDKVPKAIFHTIAGGEHNYKTFKKRIAEVISFLTM